MRIPSFAVVAGLLLLTGCVTGPAAPAPEITQKDARTMERMLTGKVAGEPVDCMDVVQTRGSTPIGQRTLLYRVSGRLVYRVEMSMNCPGLDRDDIIVTRPFAGRQCRNDIIRTVDRVSGMLSGTCSIASITPYRSSRK